MRCLSQRTAGNSKSIWLLVSCKGVVQFEPQRLHYFASYSHRAEETGEHQHEVGWSKVGKFMLATSKAPECSDRGRSRYELFLALLL